MSAADCPEYGRFRWMLLAPFYLAMSLLMAWLAYVGLTVGDYGGAAMCGLLTCCTAYLAVWCTRPRFWTAQGVLVLRELPWSTLRVPLTDIVSARTGHGGAWSNPISVSVWLTLGPDLPPALRREQRCAATETSRWCGGEGRAQALADWINQHCAGDHNPMLPPPLPRKS